MKTESLEADLHAQTSHMTGHSEFIDYRRRYSLGGAQGTRPGIFNWYTASALKGLGVKQKGALWPGWELSASLQEGGTGAQWLQCVSDAREGAVWGSGA